MKSTSASNQQWIRDTVTEWVEFNAPPDTIQVISEADTTAGWSLWAEVLGRPRGSGGCAGPGVETRKRRLGRRNDVSAFARQRHNLILENVDLIRLQLNQLDKPLTLFRSRLTSATHVDALKQPQSSSLWPRILFHCFSLFELVYCGKMPYYNNNTTICKAP